MSVRLAYKGRHRRRRVSRSIVALVLIGLLAILLPDTLTHKAAAGPGDWTMNVQPTDATELAGTPDGVYALHCSSSAAEYEASFHSTSTGAQQSTVPVTTPKTYPRDAQKAVGGDGALYGVADSDSTIVGYRAGAKLFGRTLQANGNCPTSRLA